MFCSSCGKEIQDGVSFCPHCGKAQSSSSTTSANVMGDVIPCPYCGSTDITKMGDPKGLKVKATASFVVSVVFFFFRLMPGSTGWWTLLAIGFILYGGYNLLLYLAAVQEWNDSKWNLKCNTCNKGFTIDPPNGARVITNIKSE